MSETRCCQASSTGRLWIATFPVRSISQRNRHSAAYDAGSSAAMSRSRTVPLGPWMSHSGLTKYRV